jgi:eukaryotic-like serine/threonine-protein kinase
MPIDNWERIQDLFSAAADLPRKDRARFLDEHCGPDTAVRREVESLLAADSRMGEGEKVFAAIEAEAQSIANVPTPIGSRLGAYRVVKEIGRGGMGTVYLGTRDDELYQKQVAIKLIRDGMDTADVLDRFRHERQILANLDHPYIARLIDGGTASDGRPFFVMDYVEGTPVDTFCNQGGLDVAARCRLFLLICDAVSHAHRNLVVHRDLKPGNIFVTGDGTPKLLDFGVAKLLNANAESGSAMTMSAGLLTPEYASPEQVRGLTVTTATDVYSLGAIFYELLTGVRAHSITSRTPLEIQRVICDEEVQRPSLHDPSLDADLDNIVLMAMRKEPERRYQSVDQLADDVRRHLDGRTVLARQDSFGYRAGKFAQRHRAAIAAVALFIAVLIGGTAVATLQARRAIREQAIAEQQRQRAIESQARAERSQKEAELLRGYADAQRSQAESDRASAETQRQIAAHRFEQVRQLAGKFLLDFHDSIAKLPGSTAARKMVVETGIQYYDTLIKEAHGNRDLLEEIARGYDRLGDVQGNPYYANLGDAKGALASYRKALAIRAMVADPSAEFLRDRIGGNVKMAQVLALSGDLQSADGTLRETIALAEQSASAQAYIVRDALANAYQAHGDIQFRTGKFDLAIEPYSKLLGLRTQLAREGRDPAAEQRGVSIAHAKLAGVYARESRPKEAFDHIRIAIDLDQKFVDADRNSVPLLRQLYVDYTLLSLVFRLNAQLARPGEAKETAETAADLADRMLTMDPNNSTALFDVMTAQTLVGDWFRERNEPASAVIHYSKAVDAVEKFAATGAPALFSGDALVFAHQRMASGLGKAGQLQEALDHCRKAEEYLARVEKQNPGLVQTASRQADIHSTRADAYAEHKSWKEAIAAYESADRIFDDLHQRDPKNDGHLSEQASVRIRLAGSYAAAEEWSSAVQTMQMALDLLKELALRRPLRPTEEDQRSDASARLAAWIRR